jgi:hypothetical protein
MLDQLLPALTLGFIKIAHQQLLEDGLYLVVGIIYFQALTQILQTIMQCNLRQIFLPTHCIFDQPMEAALQAGIKLY